MTKRWHRHPTARQMST